jgi:hypothetical protein
VAKLRELIQACDDRTDAGLITESIQP